jgi:hypothetical protein
MFSHIRHDFLKMIAASLVALFLAGKCPTTALAQPKEPRPDGDISVRVTAADKRYALGDPLRWHPSLDTVGTNTIVLQPGRKLQPILGFGAALTDVINVNDPKVGVLAINPTTSGRLIHILKDHTPPKSKRGSCPAGRNARAPSGQP